MHGPGAGSLPALEESSLLLQPETVGFSLMQDQYSGVLIYEILTIFLLNMNNQKAHFKKHKEKKSAKTIEPFHLFSLSLFQCCLIPVLTQDSMLNFHAQIRKTNVPTFCISICHFNFLSDYTKYFPILNLTLLKLLSSLLDLSKQNSFLFQVP